MIARARRLGAGVPSLGRLAAASWGQAAAALIALVGIRFYTARMPAGLFGEAMLVLGVLTFLDGVFGMAFNQTLVALLKDHDARGPRLGLALGLGVLFARLMLLIAAGPALLVGAAWLAGWHWPGALVLIALALVYALVEPVRIGGQVMLLLERRFMAMSSWQTADALASVAATLACLALFAPSAVSLCVGLVAGRLAATLIFWPPLFGWRALRGADLPLARAQRRRALAFGLPVSAMAPLGWVSLYLDRYIVGFTTGVASAGLLAALTGAATRPYAIVSATLTNYYRPDMLDCVAGRAPVHARPLRVWLITALAIGAAGVVGMLLFGGAIARFLIRFGSGTGSAPTLLVLIALSQVLVLLTHAIDNQVLAYGRSRTLLGSQSIAIALGLPMITAGALAGGLLGAAWGRVGNELVKFGFAVWVMIRIERRRAAGGSGSAAIGEAA